MEAILDIVVRLMVEYVIVGTGRVVVKLATFGAWRGEHASANEGRIYGAAGSLSFKRDGQRVLTRTGLLFVGLTFHVLFVVVLLALLGRSH